jgi:hypothetical protein
MTRRRGGNGNGNGNGGRFSALATLERQVTVRLMDLSLNGCMFESHCSLEEGTVGTLTVQVPQMGTYEDIVRVERTQAVVGRGQLYHIGARFMWTDAPGERSLRRLGHDLPSDAPRPIGTVRA